MEWIGTVLIAVGSSMVTCVFMEAYHARRASEEVGENEQFTE